MSDVTLNLYPPAATSVTLTLIPTPAATAAEIIAGARSDVFATPLALADAGIVPGGGGGGSGDVVGPASAVGDNLAAFDGTTGKLIKDASIPLADVETAAGAQAKADDAQTAAEATAAGALSAHTGDTANPHSVTKSQVGLDAVDNTSDVDKPVSTATQTALDEKATGPASSVDDRVALFNGTTGKLLKQAAQTVADLLARANHTGTQLAATISDFTASVTALLTWGNITGKPTEFAPSAHGHPISEVTNLQTTLDGKASTTHASTHAGDGTDPIVLFGAEGGMAYLAVESGEIAAYSYDLAFRITYSGWSFSILPDLPTGHVWVTQATLDGKSDTGHAHATTDITSGTLDGDRLPGLSASKRGGVPATGTPSGKYLKDDGTWTTIGGGGDLLAANNLSDVASAATAFANVKQAATTSATGVVELATDGENAANVAVQGNDSRLSDSRTPTAHATSHQSGGGDPIKLDDLAAPDDNTDLDATTSLHGLMPKLDKVKLDGIAAGAQVNVDTDLGYTASTRALTSSTGGDVTLPLADGTNPGLMASADFTKLAGVASGANNYSHPNHTGDVTSTGDGATAIASGVVSNAKLADVATDTLKGRTTAGTGVPEDLTASQARALLNVADGATANTGTVTSVAATVPTGLTISGSPVTTSGTLAIGLDTDRVIPTQATLDAKLAKADSLVLQLFCGDHTTAVASGTNKARFVVPKTFTATSIRFDFVNGANGGSAFTADVNLVGTGTIMTTDKLLVDASESSTATASTAPTLTTTSFTAGDILEVDFDSGSGGIGPLLTLTGTPT